MKLFIGTLLSCIATVSPAFALSWNDPGVVLGRNSAGQIIDMNTRQFVSTQGMPANAAPPVNPTPTTTTAPAAPTTPAAPAAPAAAPTNTTTPQQPKKTNLKNAAKKGAGAVAGLAIGGSMIYAGVEGQEKHGVGSVLSGVAGGAIAGAPFGTWVGAAVGAVVGGLITGSQLFSETDCLQDPATNTFTCCNTVFNKGQRQAAIGDYMFCGKEEDGKLIGYPGLVRQCTQAGSATAASWWDGLWKDDFWAPECVTRFCPTYVEPIKGIEQYTQWSANTTDYCWDWVCIDGYTRQGNTCVSNATNTIVDPSKDVSTYDPYATTIEMIQKQINEITATCGSK